MKKAFPFLLSLAVFLGFLILVMVFQTPEEKPEVTEEPEVSRTLIVHPPRDFTFDWESLAAYHDTISADELQVILEDVYTVDDTWKQVISITSETATIETSDRPFVLRLRPLEIPPPSEVKRYWRPATS